MLKIRTTETLPSRTVRSRAARIGAGAAVAAVALTGLTAPAAQALDPHDYAFDSELATSKTQVSFDVAVDQTDGGFYVTDLVLDRVLKFSSDGTHITSQGSKGNGLGKFDGARGVDVAPDGMVYVVDGGNNLIQKFDRDLNYMGQWGGSGNGDGEFSFPQDVAVDELGMVYVADMGNHRIQKFSADGAYLDQWGTQGNGSGELESPRGVAAVAGGSVLVADTDNNRISAFASDGTPIGAFGGPGAGPGKFNVPGDVEVDGAGNIYVADLANDRVQKFNGAGTFVTEWGVPGDGRGLDIDRTSGRVYVANGAEAVFSYREATSAQITTGLKATGTVGKTYTSKLVATGFPDPQFSVLSESLPKGLELNGDTVSGVKRKAGTYKVTLAADNAVGDPVVKDYEITIGKASSVLKTSWSTTKPKVKDTNTVKVRISAPETTGLSRTGNVKFYYGSTRVKTVKITSGDHGVETVRLPAFTKVGKKKVTIKYFGNSQLKGKTYVKYVYAK